MAAGVYTTGHFESKYFEINEKNVCIIERRDRVTFTDSTGTKFVGIHVKMMTLSQSA